MHNKGNAISTLNRDLFHLSRMRRLHKGFVRECGFDATSESPDWPVSEENKGHKPLHLSNSCKIGGRPRSPSRRVNQPDGSRGFYRYSNRHAPQLRGAQGAFKVLMTRWLCNSQDVSHFAAFFIVIGAKTSVAESVINFVCGLID